MARFLFVTRSLTGGGAERVISILSNNLVLMGHEAHIVLCGRSDHDYTVAPEVALHLLPGRRSTYRQKLSRITEIRRVLRKTRPDFVFSFVDNLVYATFLATRGLRTTYISAVRNNPDAESANGIERWIKLLVNRLADAVFLQTSDQAAFYPHSVQRKSFVVPNPVSHAFSQAEPVRVERIERIVTLGRLENQKNHRLLIDAFAKARTQNPSLRLTIYGEGRLRRELEAQASACGAADVIDMPGRRDDVADVLKEKDLFILSSDYEGFPNALIEAMCVGLPCIATDCPTGPRELLEGGRGILTPPGDACALADAILRMVEHPRKAAEMGARARAHVLKNYSEREIAERFAAECMRHQHPTRAKEQ